MGAMSELSAEREEAVAETYCTYREAYADYQAILEKYPPAHRHPWQQDEIGKAERKCMFAKLHWENAKIGRYRI